MPEVRRHQRVWDDGLRSCRRSNDLAACSPCAPPVPGKVTPMSKRSRKRRTRKNKSANHGRKPNA